MKKSILVLTGAGLVSLLAGCSTTAPVAVAPVGPNPSGIRTASANGSLEVFSRMTGRSEGNNPTWYQHSDYVICSTDGKVIQRVGNSTGYYSQTPKIVTLAPGQYRVKARSKDYLTVQVPVTIERGRLTRVHLDDNWQSTATQTQKNEVVSMPNGIPVGWKADAAE